MEILISSIILALALYFGLREIAKSKKNSDPFLVKSIPMARDFLGRIKKAQVVKKAEDIDKILES